jgi:pimeloyl-ACP methyl ester carboxylesterase
VVDADEVGQWVPLRPGADDLRAIAADVAEIGEIQRMLLARGRGLSCLDRVAHQYQIAGGKVALEVATELPDEVRGVGLFQPGTRYVGVGRVSTGLGTPHSEANPDFLGLMLAFQTDSGERIDFLAINDPAAPTDNHRDFMSVLHATGESAGAEVPVLGKLVGHGLADLTAEQVKLFAALERRMGLVAATRTMVHIVQQTLRTFHSSTAYQQYWTEVTELSGTGGKFTLVPTRDENPRPGLGGGPAHLSREWQQRQRQGDVEFVLYWIPFLSEAETPTRALATAWQEGHNERVGSVRFPRLDFERDEAELWAILATEIGANPGHWVHDRENSIHEPATAFGVARKIAYRASQDGRGALNAQAVRAVFKTGTINAELEGELRRRRAAKVASGHVDSAV